MPKENLVIAFLNKMADLILLNLIFLHHPLLGTPVLLKTQENYVFTILTGNLT